MKGLSNIVILDFSKLLPGPFCSMLLADLGCRVIRVELPQWRDPVREIPPRIGSQGFCYWMINRNKESLAIDFRKPKGLETIFKLLVKSDVLIEGFRPGLMERVGLGYSKLRKKFPKLVYCSITGYGQTGPMSQKAGHDINFQAQSGLMGLGDSNGSVSFPAVQAADLSGSMYGALSILAALHERAESGRGQHIDISMAETVFSWQVMALGTYFATGRSLGHRAQWWNGRSPFYRPYETKDGRHVAVGALERGFAVNLLEILGLSHMEKGSIGEYADGSEELAKAMEETFRQKTLAEWLRAFEDKDVCATPVLTLEETMRDPFFVSRGVLNRKGVNGPPAPAAHISSPMRFSRSKTDVRRAAPELGRDNAKVLRSLGIPGKTIQELRQDKILI